MLEIDSKFGVGTDTGIVTDIRTLMFEFTLMTAAVLLDKINPNCKLAN